MERAVHGPELGGLQPKGGEDLPVVLLQKVRNRLVLSVVVHTRFREDELREVRQTLHEGFLNVQKHSTFIQDSALQYRFAEEFAALFNNPRRLFGEIFKPLIFRDALHGVEHDANLSIARNVGGVVLHLLERSVLVEPGGIEL